MMPKIALLADPISKKHDPGPGHPEQPARFDAVLRALSAFPLTPFSPRAATVDEIALCHDRAYIDVVKREVEAGLTELTTGDTQICPASYEVAIHAIGTVLTAVDLLMNGDATKAFCAVRPPGHHANSDRGMGFCLFNSIAIGARYAQRTYGISRVLIADWDVHHGNGTQDIFYEDPSVFFFSTHQSPWYPGTGAARESGSGAGRGTTMNCPFEAGSGRAEILGAFESKLIPAMATFQPELVMISAGFDSRIGDPLGGFRLTDNDFAGLTKLLVAVADQYSNGRVVSVLEGGYSLPGLESAVRAHVEAYD